MRDNLCSKNNLENTIIAKEKIIIKAIDKIKDLEEDIKNGIQRYPRKNEEIIPDTKAGILRHIEEFMRAKYSLGLDCKELEELYTKAIVYIKDLKYNQVYYIKTLWFLALGILLEVPKEEFKVVVDMIDEAKVDDILLDYLANAYGVKRSYISTGFEKKRPYEDTKNIWMLAVSDMEQANKALEKYVLKDWLAGHSDYGWTKTNNTAGIYGLWSVEAAALAKILGLDDSKLKNDNHYPYDLAHYKNEKSFVKEFAMGQISNEGENYEMGIEKNPKLEEIVPPKFHKDVQQIILDYESLEDEEFWRKYDLKELWYTYEEYQNAKTDGLLGRVIIEYLVEQDYILQLDYKESVEDYIDKLKSYWGNKEIKVIYFDLDNDQQYIAKVLKECKITNVYEVKVKE